MAEYIEREKAFKLIKEQKEKETGAYSRGKNRGLIIAGSIINNKEVLPTADVAEVKHGEWITTYVDYFFKCSLCKCTSHPTNYCPNCGAKMDEEGVKPMPNDMRDRLTRLIDGFVFGTQIAVNSIEWTSETVKELADYLIANGVILPPVKVGDTVYWIENNKTIKSGIVSQFGFENYLWAIVRVGKAKVVVSKCDLLFNTKEGAEKALREKGCNSDG